MGFHIAMKYGIKDIHLIDIHKPQECIEETNKQNNLNAKFYLSDAFDNYDGQKLILFVQIHLICHLRLNMMNMTQEY